MTYLRLIYASRPVDYAPETLGAVLAGSQRRNIRDDITGALIARADLFLQMLEGPASLVDQAYARIRQDPRHENMRLLVRRETQWRLFPGWTMREASDTEWIWTPEQVAHGLPAKAPRHEVEAIFVRLWREGLTPPARRFTLRRKSLL
ncbi:hypothetical protein P775_16170 [Puniceibacterium antarcticum]|uniref:BLUF domain-containing protein n=1 Tax=Puniceibacterium antarcticum TaxID=1206336 RepID=A0A2G8RC14_9RHOB|nr:BLUF domain-containing protein [Puniceibacterium antarcticum]PIL19116.1 hypothetical protein P775_16170 [Puniceibacterium antarcticum]